MGVFFKWKKYFNLYLKRDPVLVCKYYFYKNITLKIDSKQLFISAR